MLARGKHEGQKQPAVAVAEDSKPFSLSDEEMRKLLKPIPVEADILKILTTSYVTGHAAIRVIRQLDSYDDCNWKVEIAGELFLVKIHNGFESNDFIAVFEAAGNDYYKKGHAGSVIHFQNAIAETLNQHGIPTSVPVKPLGSDSPISIHTLPVLSDAHSPTPLAVRLLKWVEGRPMVDIPLLPLEALAGAGRTLGKLDAALDQLAPDSPLVLYHQAECQSYETLYKNQTGTGRSEDQQHLQDASLMVAARRYHQWDGKNTADLRKFVSCIADTRRRDMVESVIAAFERQLVQSGESQVLRKGIIMGDFNDANVLVDHDLQVSGVIDFGDSVER